MINRFKKKIKNLFSITSGSPPTDKRKNDSKVSSPKHNENNKKHSKSRKKNPKTHHHKARNIHYSRHEEPGNAKVKNIKVPPMPRLVTPPPGEGKTRFSDFDSIPDQILCGLQDLKFKYCTEVQEKSLPFTLAGKDITGKAQTGTGKTAAFLISAFTHLLKNKQPENRGRGTARTMILAPTRELAIQIHKEAEEIGKYCGFHNLAIFGGMDRHKQKNSLNNHVDIAVGTPGRILDFCGSGNLDLSKVEIFVIDEADRMLDMGFIPDVKRIESKMPRPEKRQTMLFSATLPRDILNLANRWLNNPERVEVEPENVVTDLIEQKFYTVAEREKFQMLTNLMRKENYERILIFSNRKDKNNRLASKLNRSGINCEVLSGDIEQKKRLKILEGFKNGRIKVIAATDVASRGIHVEGISLVINYDLPVKPEDYVHRIGRTGRAGETGKSISFVCENGAYVVDEIEAIIGKKVVCSPLEELETENS